MAVNLKIKNQSKVDINPTNVENIVRKTSRFVDLKMDLGLKKTGNPNYFDQSMVNGTDIEISVDEDAIRQYLINLFSCAPGDLYLNPNFGLNLKRFVFEPVNANTAQLIGDAIYNSIYDMTEGAFITPAGRNDNFNIKKVLITPKIDISTFEIEILFYIAPLDKSLTLKGSISPINGVQFT